MNATSQTAHPIVTRERWLAERAALLALEKEHTRAGDELAPRRRELPWVEVEKRFTLHSADGERTLLDLFLMAYYGFLDRAPRGRDEGEDDWQLWIRRRDEYEWS